MFNRKSVFLFLLSSFVCSLLFIDQYIYVIIGIVLVILFMYRGIFYTLQGNRYLVRKDFDKGYKLIKRAYKSHTVPTVVIAGYIFLSLKHGYEDEAEEAIDYVLDGKVQFKVKETHRKQILSYRALLLWKRGDMEGAITQLESLYDIGYRNSAFYGNYACLLYLDNRVEEAEKIALEGYEYSSSDAVTLDNLVAIYIAMERWEEADKYSKELLELDPKFPEAFYHGALIALNRGDNSKAQELLEISKKLPIYNLSSISSQDINSLLNRVVI